MMYCLGFFWPRITYGVVMRDLHFNFGWLDGWGYGDDQLPHLLIHLESNRIIAITVSFPQIHNETFHYFFWGGICEEEVLTFFIKLELIQLKNNLIFCGIIKEISPFLRSVPLVIKEEILGLISYSNSSVMSILRVLHFWRSSSSTQTSLSLSLSSTSLPYLIFNFFIWGHTSLYPQIKCFKVLKSFSVIIMHKNLKEILEVLTRRSLLFSFIRVGFFLLTFCMLIPELIIFTIHKKSISVIIDRT